MSAPEAIRIEPADPQSEEAQALITALDAYQSALYPPQSNHLDGPKELASPSATFVLAYLAGQVQGCGAIKLFDAYAEIKRVYVSPEARGQGLGRAIVVHLEQVAARQNHGFVRLETGIHQAAALALYEELGYRFRGPFGAYTDDPLSLFMEKNLASGEAG